MILMLRCDSSEVYVGVWENGAEKEADSWAAGRELSSQLLPKITAFCEKAAIKKNEITGIIVFEGPGSYTGLRISISVANAIGYSNTIPVIGVAGDSWQEEGLAKLSNARGFTPVNPVYGRDVYTTKPRK